MTRTPTTSQIANATRTVRGRAPFRSARTFVDSLSPRFGGRGGRTVTAAGEQTAESPDDRDHTGHEDDGRIATRDRKTPESAGLRRRGPAPGANGNVEAPDHPGHERVRVEPR